MRINLFKKNKSHAVFLVFSIILFSHAEWEESQYSGMVSELFTTAASSALSAADLAVSHSGPFLYNPGNLARPDAGGLTITYSDFYKSLFNASGLHYVTPLDQNSGLGISLAYLYIPGIEDTRNLEANETIIIDDLEHFSATDIWFRVGYGSSLSLGATDILYGAAVNLRRRRSQVLTGYGIGVDGGVVVNYQAGTFGALENVIISGGVMAENVTGSYHHWTSSYKEYTLPHVRLSLAVNWNWDVPLPGSMLFVYTSPDMLSNEGINFHDGDDENDPEQIYFREDPALMLLNGRYGLEYEILNTLAIRAGLDQRNLSMGGGLKFFDGRLSTDFSYILHHLSGKWKFSVTYQWF
ncbi:hypothetical protein CHISP_0699 [Chitinispirillum alkaliphilum]|nr:hypothetical protein CHISP_0699 [Chitinispirillum alkaliphilum]